MKVIIFVLGVLTVGLAQAQRSPICTVDTPHLNFCQRMKHLRSTVNVLDSQPALMQVNYPFLSGIALDLNQNTEKLIELLPAGLADHKQALEKLLITSAQLQQQADHSSPEAMTIANMAGAQCMTCHSTRTPNSSIPWNDLFGNGWDKISKECHRDGANPYLCKTMNGLMSNLNHIVTSYVAKTENHLTLSSVASEILRLLNDLGKKNFDHVPNNLRVTAETQVQEVLRLSQSQDPLAFEKARDLNSACMQCHNNVAFVTKGQLSGGKLHLVGVKLFP